MANGLGLIRGRLEKEEIVFFSLLLFATRRTGINLYGFFVRTHSAPAAPGARSFVAVVVASEQPKDDEEAPGATEKNDTSLPRDLLLNGLMADNTHVHV